MAEPVHQRVTRATGVSTFKAILAGLAVVSGLSFAPPAAAASVRSLTHDQVLEAVQSGRLAPLETILGAVRSAFEQQMIDVRALEKDGSYLFEILMLEPDGAVLQLFYDGGTAELVAWTGVGAENKADDDVFIDSLFVQIRKDGAGARGVPPPER